jgi:hypothetical protein
MDLVRAVGMGTATRAQKTWSILEACLCDRYRCRGGARPGGYEDTTLGELQQGETPFARGPGVRLMDVS